jgi:hypothetical protein
MMRRKRTWPALLAALALTAAPLSADALEADDPSAEGWNWKKFWDYGGCAASLVVAVSTGGIAWVAPVIACGRAFQEHWTD